MEVSSSFFLITALLISHAIKKDRADVTVPFFLAASTFPSSGRPRGAPVRERYGTRDELGQIRQHHSQGVLS